MSDESRLGDGEEYGAALAGIDKRGRHVSEVAPCK